LFWTSSKTPSLTPILKRKADLLFKSITTSLHSLVLDRLVTITLMMPNTYDRPLALLVLNDGQDHAAMKLEKTYQKCLENRSVKPFLWVAVHDGDRLQEYGVAGMPDYKGRGAKAAAYTHFVLKELLPWLNAQFPISQQAADRVMAGCSLGGLSAFDIAWNHPQVFSKVGAFSAAFWWRKRALDAGYSDADRIAHHLVRLGKGGKALQFFLEVGTEDEKCDRNNNGVIDSIDDTLDLITELILKGYALERDIRYLEVKGGKHDLQTWGKVMPEFITWAFSTNVNSTITI
jgi:enterochelin esterase family protein